jgi:hypothetical protein
VSGWYALRGALPTTDEPITLVAGQYVKPALRLQWEFYGWAMTLDGRLEGDTMIVGTLSSKEGSTPVRFYRRTAAVTRARVAERGLDLPVR